MIKVTLTVPPGQEATPVYEAEGGLPVELADDPYLDSTGLQVPLPIVDAGGPVYLVSDGSLQAALAVTGLEPDVPDDGVTHLGVLVTHNGEIVTHA